MIQSIPRGKPKLAKGTPYPEVDEENFSRDRLNHLPFQTPIRGVPSSGHSPQVHLNCLNKLLTSKYTIATSRQRFKPERKNCNYLHVLKAINKGPASGSDSDTEGQTFAFKSDIEVFEPLFSIGFCPPLFIAEAGCNT
jgi:hypothetical protein